MPHSEKGASPLHDNMAAETGAEIGDTSDAARMPDGNTSGEGQDISMEDVDGQGEKAPEFAVKEEANLDIKLEVKLDDLFADVESDEEFSSSNIKTSSPPEAPSSPVYMSFLSPS